MKQDKIPSILLYESFTPQFNLLSIEDRGRLITAILEYGFHGYEEKDLPPILQMAFCPIKAAIDRDHANYLEKCRKNAENGKKGGRPKKRFFNEETAWFLDEPIKANNNNNNNNKDNHNFYNKNNDNDKNNDKDSEPSIPSVFLEEETAKELKALGISDRYLLSRGFGKDLP